MPERKGYLSGGWLRELDVAFQQFRERQRSSNRQGGGSSVRDADNTVPRESESFDNSLNFADWIYWQDSEVVANRVRCVGRKLNLNVALLRLSRCSQTTGGKDGSPLHVLLQMRGPSLGRQLELQLGEQRNTLTMIQTKRHQMRQGEQMLVDPFLGFTVHVLP